MTPYDITIQQHLLQGWRIESQTQYATVMVKGQARVRQGFFGGWAGLMAGDGLKRRVIETDGWGRARVRYVS